MKNPKISIIGAGLAGLTTGYRLQEKNIPFQLFEARSRIGGRVFTIKVADHLVEMGGQNFLDGGEAKHLKTLARELGLETIFKKRPSTLFFSDGKELFNSNELFKKNLMSPEVLRATLQTLKNTSANMEEVFKKFFVDDERMYHLCKMRLSAYEGTTIENLSSHYVETLYHILMGGLSATHPNKDEDFQLETLSIKKGNGYLTESIAKKLDGKIHLKHALKALIKNVDGSYLLHFENGLSIMSDVVIFAIPCPTFKNIEIDHAAISMKKKNLIQAIQYGTNAKIAVPISSAEPSLKVYGNERLIAFTNQDPHVLNLYYMGQYGRFNQQNISTLFQHDLPFIRDFYKLPHLSDPVMAMDQVFASYTGPVGHSWPEDPFAGGSYSCIGAGQDEVFTSTTQIHGEVVKKLFMPIENSIFFAGEHTCTDVAVGGTMEAAVESGEKVARLVFSRGTSCIRF